MRLTLGNFCISSLIIIRHDIKVLISLAYYYIGSSSFLLALNLERMTVRLCTFTKTQITIFLASIPGYRYFMRKNILIAFANFFS